MIIILVKIEKGGPEFLTKYCLDNSINLEIIEPVSDDDNHISSTRIRNLIKMVMFEEQILNLVCIWF